MDSIDIIDSAFSLANIPSIIEQSNNAIETITETVTTNMPSMPSIPSMPSHTNVDNSSWLYLGIVLIIISITAFVYKHYIKSKKHVQFDDDSFCPGGFCTMDKCAI